MLLHPLDYSDVSQSQSSATFEHQSDLLSSCGRRRGGVVFCAVVVVCWSFCCATAVTLNAPIVPTRVRMRLRQSARFNIRSPASHVRALFVPESCRSFRFLRGFVGSHLDLTLVEAGFPAPYPKWHLPVSPAHRKEKTPSGAPNSQICLDVRSRESPA